MFFTLSPSLRLALGGLIGMAVAMGLGRFAYTPILPGMMTEMGMSPAQAGFVASANFAGYLAGAIAAAGDWGSGRERAVLLAGLGATALLAFAMGLTESVAVFAILRFLAGAASAFVLVFLSTVVFGRLAAAGRSELQAVHFAGVGFGIALSSILMLFLVGAGARWPAGWFWSGALATFGLAAVAALIGPAPPRETRAPPEPALVRTGALARLTFAYALFGFGYVVTATFLIAIVRQGDGGRVFEGLVWLVAGIAAVPSVYLWNRASARIGLMPAFALACGVEALGVAASVGLGGRAGPLLAALLLGGTFLALTAIGLQAGRLAAGKSPRRAMARMTAAFGVGQIVGPIAAGVIAQGSGSFVAPSLSAALALLLSAAVAWSVGSTPKSP